MKRLLALSLLFLCAAAGADTRRIESRFPQPEKIVAIGDVHGDVEALISILKARKLIQWSKRSWQWTGKKSHLVLVGDLVDRGPDSRAVLDFLYDLEKKAEAKGGKIGKLILRPTCRRTAATLLTRAGALCDRDF